MNFVSYCINALCDQRLNKNPNAVVCESCGASLLIKDRYRLIKQYRPENFQSRIKVYEGLDIQSNLRVIAKIDEMYSKKLPNLLKREQQIMTYFSTDLFAERVTQDNYFEIQSSPEIEEIIAAILILPMIDGIDSEAWIIQNGPINQEQAILWSTQVIPYLRRLSELAILHRDIKPSNLIVSNNETLTLIDYGTGREMNDEYMAIISGDVVNSFTQDYQRITRIYSAGYTAPEQSRGKPIPQSDYFSLGRTVIYWISGVSPNDLIDLDSNQFDWSRLRSPYKFDQCFLEFLERLTHPNPVRRPLTLDDIEVFLKDRLPQLIQAEKRRHSKTARLLRIMAIITGGVSLMLMGLAAIWYGVSQTLYSQGLEALERTQYETSRQKFEAVLKINRFHGDALYYLGLDCQRRGESACAEEYYQKSIQWTWNPAGPQYQLGVLAESQGNFTKARELYLASIQSRLNPEAYHRLARLDIQQGKLDKAQTAIQAGLKIANDDDMNARLLAQQGRIYYAQERWMEAAEALRKSSNLSNKAESVCLLPKVFEKLKRPSHEVTGLWYTCFYTPNEYPEGADYKAELLERALPSLFFEE